MLIALCWGKCSDAVHGVQRRARRSAAEAPPVSGAWQRLATEPPAPASKRLTGQPNGKQGWNDGSGRWSKV